MNLSPEHIGLAAQDAVALKNWYVRVLGASVVRELSTSPPAFMLEMPGGWWLEIYAAESAAGTPGNRVAGWRHLALRVDSIDSAREQLAGLGVRFDEPVKPAGGGGRVLFFCDAEGNLLHLVERTAAGV